MIAGKISKIYLAKKMTFPIATQVPSDVLRDYVGTYEFAPGVLAEVTLENGVLWIKPPGGKKTKLFAESKDAFFPEGMEETNLLFKRNDIGNVSSFTVKDGANARRLQ